MNFLRHPLATVVYIVLGVLVIIYGGMDDAPGLQVIGLVLIARGLFLVMRRKRQGS